MSILIYDHGFDEGHGFSHEEAIQIIPRVELEEPIIEGEVVVAMYWQHMRRCQLFQKEYQIKPTKENLDNLLSLLYELPPPYNINWMSNHYKKQLEHLDELRRKLVNVKPFFGKYPENELRHCENKVCTLCNHKGLIAHDISNLPEHLISVTGIPIRSSYIGEYWCPNCKRTLLPSDTLGEPIR